MDAFLTAEQRAELEAVYARFAGFTQIDNATSYEALLQTLEMAGLSVDTLVDDQGNGEDVITVENLKAATAWWEMASANAYEDGIEGDE